MTKDVLVSISGKHIDIMDDPARGYDCLLYTSNRSGCDTINRKFCFRTIKEKMYETGRKTSSDCCEDR